MSKLLITQCTSSKHTWNCDYVRVSQHSRSLFAWPFFVPQNKLILSENRLCDKVIIACVSYFCKVFVQTHRLPLLKIIIHFWKFVWHGKPAPTELIVINITYVCCVCISVYDLCCIATHVHSETGKNAKKFLMDLPSVFFAFVHMHIVFDSIFCCMACFWVSQTQWWRYVKQKFFSATYGGTSVCCLCEICF